MILPIVSVYQDLKEDQGTKAIQHAGSSYLSVIIFPNTKNGDKRDENY